MPSWKELVPILLFSHFVVHVFTDKYAYRLGYDYAKMRAQEQSEIKTS